MADTLRTSWHDHYMLPAYLGFLHSALGDAAMLAQYRQQTGDEWTPGKTSLDRLIDKATGANLAFLQRFSDWCEREHFGTPADLEEDNS